MPVNFRRPYVINSDAWDVNSGASIGIFNYNGAAGDNMRVNATDPFGNTSIVWEARTDGIYGADGGWSTNTITIDPTKLYRFSVWVRRTSSTYTGNLYFGTGYGTQNNLLQLDGSANTNPYWYCTNIGNLTQNAWGLCIGHIFPYTYTGLEGHPNTGIWTITGGRVGALGCNLGYSDMKFQSTTTDTVHRAFMYYATNASDVIQFFDPRVEICDGSEGTIESLLSNTKDNVLATTTPTRIGSAFKVQNVLATGGDISYLGEWKIHKFTSTTSFVISSYLGSGLPIEYLLVGGGGGGGMDMGGGGGGGGVLTGTMILTGKTYTVTVGGGGTGGPAGCSGSQPCDHQFTISATNGTYSSFNGLTAYGGGFGGSSYWPYSPNYGTAGTGGCGGASSGYSIGPTAAGAAGVSGQGYAGGQSGPSYYSGGGGGAGAVGVSSTSVPTGGAGKFCGILGRPYYWGGGGGGAAYSVAPGGNGGKGGGGGGAIGSVGGSGGNTAINWGAVGQAGASGAQTNVPGGNGGQYSGGGGGGGSHYNRTNAGGNGGSGIVVIRYKYK